MLECSDLPLPHSPFLLLPKSQPHPLAVDVCDNPPSPAPFIFRYYYYFFLSLNLSLSVSHLFLLFDSLSFIPLCC